jgi:hypothetical protein
MRLTPVAITTPPQLTILSNKKPAAKPGQKSERTGRRCLAPDGGVPSTGNSGANSSDELAAVDRVVPVIERTGSDMGSSIKTNSNLDQKMPTLCSCIRLAFKVRKSYQEPKRVRSPTAILV